ncbi:MAG: PASTA domain-containing protein [Oscillospiraceae bacterium]
MDFEKNLCMGCMNELDENGVCHYCSYTDDSPYLQSYLAPRTVLNNRYIVGKMLSYNGEGASYICYDTVANAKAVVREYIPDTLCERERGSNNIVVDSDCLAKYKTFMSEFVDMNKILAKMRNLEHIVTVEDTFYENNTAYVIFDYVEGVSLKKFLQSNKGFLTWEQVKKLFVPLFTTLSIIHNAGIIHRGISPENIIVTTGGELKLTGFSISSIRTSNTGLSTEFYSGYTAPEQYSCLEWQGTWTDVYAIAAVTYRILTGVMPLDASTRIYNDTMPEAAKVNPRVPYHVSKVLAKAMRVKGSERIQTITELVSALFEPRHQMEHQKGATQTIPVQKPSDIRNNNQEEAPSSKINAGAVAAGIIILALIVGLGIFLVYQIVSGPEDDDSAVSIAESSSVVENSFESSEIQTSTTEKKSVYGYGSIMPSLINMRYETAVRQLGNDFNIRPEYFYSDEIEKGIITDQSIPVGSDYDPDRKNELVLKVSKGSELVAVPSYSGVSEKDYLSILDSLEIKYEVEKDYSTNVSEGRVISTSVAPGNKINIREGEILTVVVSKGAYQPPITTQQTVPTTTPPAQTTPADIDSSVGEITQNIEE